MDSYVLYRAFPAHCNLPCNLQFIHIVQRAVARSSNNRPVHEFDTRGRSVSSQHLFLPAIRSFQLHRGSCGTSLTSCLFRSMTYGLPCLFSAWRLSSIILRGNGECDPRATSRLSSVMMTRVWCILKARWYFRREQLSESAAQRTHARQPKAHSIARLICPTLVTG